MSLVVQLQCLLQLAQFRYYFDALNCILPLIAHSMIMLPFCLQSLILLKLRFFLLYKCARAKSCKILVTFKTILIAIQTSILLETSQNHEHHAWHMVEWHAKIMVHLLHVCEVCSIVWDFAILNSLWMVSIMGDQSAHGKCILYEIQYMNCEALFGICNGDCVLD